MLSAIFMQILNMSYTTCFIIAAVLLIRLILKRAPKVFSYLLWAVVLFRLLCPISFESAYSVMPSTRIIQPEIIEQSTFSIDSGITAIDTTVNDYFKGHYFEGISAVEGTMRNVVTIASIIWLVGIAVLLLYSAVSLIKLRRKLVGSVKLRDNIYLADHIASPFVMGLFHPKIYLPSALPEQEQSYIILHEQCHIHRLDHITKILAFLALCVYWFNPLVWLTFALSGKDMEMSCDEAVMKKIGGDIRAEYSTSLLSLATGKKIIVGTPLAFGEGNPKSRIKNVMNYKKPAFWVLVVCLAMVISLCTFLMLNPKQDINLFGTTYQVEEILYSDGRYSFTYTKETAPIYSITADNTILEKENTPDAEWIHKGNLYPVEYRNCMLSSLIRSITTYLNGLIMLALYTGQIQEMIIRSFIL